MKTSQAVLLIVTLAGLAACAPSEPLIPTSSPEPPTQTPELTFTFTPSPPTMTPTSTPFACLAEPGRIEAGSLETVSLPQEYYIYLPPCYDERTDLRYPVLYLLHGQTYTADQWIRIGAVDVLDELIHSGESQPFIIVFPDDQYWNTPVGPGFGQRLVDLVIPHIDANYRTQPDRSHRGIGGMSRGAGWALRLGLTRWDLFSVIGLHSLAVLQKDALQVDGWLGSIPPASFPEIYMDTGDNDQGLSLSISIEDKFNEFNIPHEWHRYYTGNHTEKYWSAHLVEYMTWYAEQWNINE